MSNDLRARIRLAIYTEDRAMWLDPEDLEGIVEDVMRVLPHAVTSSV